MINSSTSLSLSENDRNYLREVISMALKDAIILGASDAVASISESKGLSVSVRKNNIDTIEHTHDRSLSLVVFNGKRSGSSFTSDFSAESIKKTVEAAFYIAKHTAIDYASGLPEPSLFAQEQKDFDVYHKWHRTTEEIIDIAKISECSAMEFDNKIINTDGSFIDCEESYSLISNTLGFCGDHYYSDYSLSVVPIASDNNGSMQRDFWCTNNCNPNKLLDPVVVGRIAAERTLSRIDARRIPTGKYPVLFEAPVALGLIGSFAQASSGSNLYRKSSFLIDALGRKIFPDFIDIVDDPHIYGEIGSSSFDSEGVATKKRKIVSGGILEGYFLSTYSARKLGMTTTGNAGGSHNLYISSNRTLEKDCLDAMIKRMDRGLLVTELIGQGINYVTGDYSRGVFGYWVENGQIQHAVQEVTIAGNLLEMFSKIVAVGSDQITRGNKTSGSILIENMSVAGY
ncbi:MAG: metalloprotease PmbA [Candidatus Kinetoplastibacterium crithidii]|nr:MAG: metalloprotease PmbA [Candidatus Kinetoplastibacterium crithidii]